jgi:hypothetical protein
MSHIVIARSHPLQYYGIRLLFLLFAAALLWGAYEMGYMQSEEDIIEAKGGRNSLIVQQKVLKKQNRELRKDLLHLERKYLVEQESCQLVKLTLNQDKQKIVELEKEVNFLKGIVSPSSKKDSIYLQSLSITPINNTGEEQSDTGKSYQYQFIVAQTMKKHSYSKGNVKITFSANKGNKKVEFLLNSIISDDNELKKAKAFKYGFKYFQEFNGIITIPNDVIPKSISVVIDSKKKKSIVELNDLAWSKNEGINYVGK